MAVPDMKPSHSSAALCQPWTYSIPRPHRGFWGLGVKCKTEDPPTQSSKQIIPEGRPDGRMLESKPTSHSLWSGGSCPMGLGLDPHSRHCDLAHRVAAPIWFGLATLPSWQRASKAKTVWLSDPTILVVMPHGLGTFSNRGSGWNCPFCHTPIPRWPWVLLIIVVVRHHFHIYLC